MKMLSEQIAKTARITEILSLRSNHWLIISNFRTDVAACAVDRNKEEELCRVTASQKQQAELAEKALDDFKLQVENSSAKMYQDMKMQVW